MPASARFQPIPLERLTQFDVPTVVDRCALTPAKIISDFCGSVHVPNPTADGVRMLGELSAVQCPRCIAPPMQAAVGGQRILYCERCHGMLIRMEAFATLVQDLRSHRDMATVLPFDPKDLDQRTNCPSCGQQMDAHLYGGGGNVVISDCEHCEVNWLECGELGRIVRAPDRQYSRETWEPLWSATTP